MSESPEDRRARKALRREWEARGRLPCPVCGAAIECDDEIRVSLLWRAVIHPFCVRAKVARPSPAQMASDPCPLYPDCPIRFHPGTRDSCARPMVSAINIVFVARRFGKRTVDVPTAFSLACQRAAKKAGLGRHYRGVPLRELPRFDLLREHGRLGPGVDESIWDELSNAWEPPEYLSVDVDRTIREGRVVAALSP